MRLKTYRNSTTVIRINNYDMKVEDIVLATLISGQNLLLVSERGEGKTQILYDVLYGIFGGKGTYVRVSPDMEIKDVYTALNLEKLREKKGTTRELIEKTELVEHPFTAIDELNRAPPIVQNQLLNVCDGYIEMKGARYHLGIPFNDKRYHTAIATINLGDHRYVGTFGMDSALLDRFAIALDLDQYTPSTEDLMEIMKSEPRLKEPEKGDYLKEILQHFGEIEKRELPVEPLIVALYLREGVDYISAEPYSQRKVGGRLPEGSHETGDIQGIMMPVSIRTVKQICQTYKATTYLAEMKGYGSGEDYYFDNSLEILKLVLPHSGCLKRGAVDSRFYGNSLLATEEMIKRLKEKIEDKMEDIATAIKAKHEGRLEEKSMERFKDEWKFMRDWLKNLKV